MFLQKICIAKQHCWASTLYVAAIVQKEIVTSGALSHDWAYTSDCHTKISSVFASIIWGWLRRVHIYASLHEMPL
jgi:hypothetical protein